MAIIPFLALLLLGCVIAFLDWRRGWYVALLCGVLQDPVRKLTPGSPVAITFSIVLVYLFVLIASHVTLVHRRTELRAGAALRASLLESDIEVLTPYVVDEVLGGDLGVTGVRVRDVDDGSVRDLDVTGLFVAIGHEPASGLFEAYLKTDGHGFLWTESGTTATSVPGVFAAGDVADPRYRQAITAAASGCAAAIDAERWLLAHREQPSSPMHTKEEPHAGW